MGENIMKTAQHKFWGSILLAGFLLLSGWGRSPAEAMGTAFTYQGRLTNSGMPVNDTCDLVFKLYNAASGGTQIYASVTKTGLPITDGLFTTMLDFDIGAFDGSARWLDICAKCGTETTYTMLSPRQELTPVPYAIYAANQNSGVFENHSGLVRNTGTHASDDFVFGSPQFAHNGNSGYESRFFFDKDLSAFRAGLTNGIEWDIGNIGINSVAMGFNTTAYGHTSTALGYGTRANGNASTALGESAISSGYASVAAGYYTSAGGDYTIAMGDHAIAGGNQSTSIGLYTTASGAISLAMGGNTIAESYVETVLGFYDTNYTPGSAAAWNSSDRLFVIGNGQSNSTRSDALVMLKNGNTMLKGQLTLTDGSSSYSLPNTDGTDGQVLQTDGSGMVSWTNSPVTFENYSGVVRNTGNHASDHFVFGSPQLADDGDTTHDTRLFFDKSKGAFRAGKVGEAQWDDTNVGLFSTASGFGTMAKGAMSIAMGYACLANEESSVAIGQSANASGYASVALGHVVAASGAYATALGNNTIAESSGEFVIGAYDTNYSPYSAVSWDTRDRLFVVGNGSDGVRSDALVMLKNGDTTLKGHLTLTNGGSSYTLPNTDGANGQVLQTNGSGAVIWDDGSWWNITGNAGTTPGMSFLGTTDNQALEFKVNSERALRIEPAAGESPNLIGGARFNTVDSGVRGATIGGGGKSPGANRVTDDYNTIGGGTGNQAGNNTGTLSDASYATVGGGNRNVAGADSATVAGGNENVAAGNYSMISGGSENNAAGNYSFAAGRKARASHDGTFVWADSGDYNFSSTASNEFSVRARGGARFVTAIDGAGNPIAGVSVSPGGGSWSSLSDRNAKEHFNNVNVRNILTALMTIPIQTWNYKTQDDEIRHIGPVAQDFSAAFQIGENDTTISTVDADGVTLAAIQGVYQILLERDTLIAEQQAKITELEEKTVRIDELEAKIRILEQQTAQFAAQQAAIDLLMQRLTALENSQHPPVAAIKP